MLGRQAVIESENDDDGDDDDDDDDVDDVDDVGSPCFCFALLSLHC